MSISEIFSWLVGGVFVFYLLNQMYIVVIAFRWRSQDRVIARALEPRDD